MWLFFYSLPILIASLEAVDERRRKVDPKSLRIIKMGREINLRQARKIAGHCTSVIAKCSAHTPSSFLLLLHFKPSGKKQQSFCEKFLI